MIGLITPRATSKVAARALGALVTTMVAAGRTSTNGSNAESEHPPGATEGAEEEETEAEEGKKGVEEAEGMPRSELMKASWICRFCRSTNCALWMKGRKGSDKDSLGGGVESSVCG